MREEDLQEFLVLVQKYLTKRGKCTLCGIILCRYQKHPVTSGGYIKKYLVKVLALKIC